MKIFDSFCDYKIFKSTEKLKMFEIWSLNFKFLYFSNFWLFLEILNKFKTKCVVEIE